MKLQKLLFLFLFFMAGGVSAQATVGALGTPPNGSTVSGISAVSGYHCTSKNIDVFIDGVFYSKAGAGTQINTASVCNGRTDTGFSYLYNFSNLPNGQHTVTVTADGIPFGTNTVTTVKSGGEQFLTGMSKKTKLPDFPHAGQASTLEWVQSYQNFLVTGIGDTANDLSSLSGNYVQSALISANGSSCSSYGFPTGNQTIVITVGASVATPSFAAIYVVPTAATGLCSYALATSAGNSATGYDLNGSAGCSYATTVATAAATGIKKAADGMSLLGTVISNFPGCTQTVVLN